MSKRSIIGVVVFMALTMIGTGTLAQEATSNPKLMRLLMAMETAHHQFTAEKKPLPGRGPFHITERQWKLSKVTEGKYEDCDDRDYAMKVLVACWKEVAPEALAKPDLVKLVRAYTKSESFLERVAPILGPNDM